MIEISYELRASHEILSDGGHVVNGALPGEFERKLRSIHYWISPQARTVISVSGRADPEHLAHLLAAGRLALVELRREVILPGNRTSGDPEAPPVIPPVAPDVDRDWIEIELLDPDGRPMPGELCKVRRTDGTTIQRALDANGKLRFDGIPSGICDVSFPALGTSGGTGAA